MAYIFSSKRNRDDGVSTDDGDQRPHSKLDANVRLRPVREQDRGDGDGGHGRGSNPVPTDGIPTLAYDNTSNRINTSGWQYDNAGNMVRGQNASGVWQRFEYDAANRLVKIKDDSGNPVETYVYGADRKRLMTGDAAVGGRVYVWGGGAVVAEYNAGSGVVSWDKSYFYAGSRLVATSTYYPYDKIDYYHPDRLGSKLVTDPYANTSYEQSTLPFGTALNAESTGYSNQTFTSTYRIVTAKESENHALILRFQAALRGGDV